MSDDDLFKDTATAVTTQARWHGVLEAEMARPMSPMSGESVRQFLADGCLERGVEALARVRSSLEGESR